MPAYFYLTGCKYDTDALISRISVVSDEANLVLARRINYQAVQLGSNCIDPQQFCLLEEFLCQTKSHSLMYFG